MRHHKIEPRFRQLEVEVGIDERVVAYVDSVLVIETHRCRLEIHSFIPGEIVAVETELHMKSGYAEYDIHVSVQRQLWHWYDILPA